MDAVGAVTSQLLKQRSGEFDLESIHTLKLSGLDIADLGCVGECAQLERLDLSRNSVSRLYALASLTNLQYLNLSANRIASLEGLQTLDNLIGLNLSGNLICSVDSLQTLAGLEKLEQLRLQEKLENGLTNPVCSNVNYAAEVRAILPKLKMLDGEKLSGRGRDFYELCAEIDRDLRDGICRDGPVREKTMPTPWLPSSYWAVAGACEADDQIASQAEEQVDEFLTDCRRLGELSTAVLDDIERKIGRTETETE
ncbi:leucine-rich repeat-containing protein 61-like [Tubulanus polymorphus]|uniref:leucine-rich repeat-containing protein 61-like n=1 Tax=Tubulanus polymorphus TaxID=672921 RepID=UPI003DA2DF63